MKYLLLILMIILPTCLFSQDDNGLDPEAFGKHLEEEGIRQFEKEINDNSLEDIIIKFFEDKEDEARPLTIIPDMYDPLIESYNDKEEWYIEELPYRYQINDDLIGSWEYYNLGEIENLSYGILANIIDVENTIKSQYKEKLTFSEDGIMHKHIISTDKDFKYHWITLSDNSFLLIEIDDEEQLEEAHLVNIENNKYIIFIQDLYELPLSWIDVGLLIRH